MKRGTCATCAFYHVQGNDSECRALPPVPIKDEYRDELYWFWPRVNDDDWCGLYELGIVDEDTGKHTEE